MMIGGGDFSSDNLFYTRRIGRRPNRGSRSRRQRVCRYGAEYFHSWGIQDHGQDKNGLSIGIINSVTAEEKGQISKLDQFHQETVEPLTNYFGLRLQKDYNQGNTIVETMLTTTNHNIKIRSLIFSITRLTQVEWIFTIDGKTAHISFQLMPCSVMFEDQPKL